MSVCVVIRDQSEASFLMELGLRIAGAWEEVLEIWIARSEKPEEGYHAHSRGMDQ